ncbi:MAG: dTDP-glucose 4,6-dehydratase [Bacteroidales bacterium]
MLEVLVTGGAGFIGSNFVHYALAAHPDWHVTTLDKLTYAGRLENLEGVLDDPRHAFVRGDIADEAVAGCLVERADIVVHFAAETHVDRSIHGAADFIRTDVFGTYVLLEAARRAKHLARFIQISTDEVYGSVPEGASRETDELKPRNPYAASKAGADRLAYSFWATYGVPVSITRASNNYGPRQFPEKVIPLFITNAFDRQPLPLYGDGQNVRDWLHVEDHCRALDLVIAQGGSGEVYNIGGGNEVTNADLTRLILEFADRPASLITPVPDRPGHDRRYALDTTKVRALGWQPQHDFGDGLRDTVRWYRDNEAWWRPIKQSDAAFKTYYATQYGDRLKLS